MLLIIKDGERVLKEIPLASFDLEKISYSDDKVKEICFIRILRNSDDIRLKTLYDEINLVDTKKATDVIVYYSKDKYMCYHNEIKSIYYRTMDYLNGGREYQLREQLSIRFDEDNFPKVITEENIAFCDKKHCAYYNTNFCNKYSEELLTFGEENLICRSCYLEMWPVIGKAFFQKMDSLYNLNFHIEGEIK